jgi:hypothetical protein
MTTKTILHFSTYGVRMCSVRAGYCNRETKHLKKALHNYVWICFHSVDPMHKKTRNDSEYAVNLRFDCELSPSLALILGWTFIFCLGKKHGSLTGLRPLKWIMTKTGLVNDHVSLSIENISFRTLNILRTVPPWMMIGMTIIMPCWFNLFKMGLSPLLVRW